MHNDQSESTQKSTPAEVDGLDKTQPSAPGQRLSYNKGETPGQKPVHRQKSPTVRERSYSYFADRADANNEDTRQMGEDEKENLSSSDAPSEPFLSFGDGYQQNNNAAPAARSKRKAEPEPEHDDMLGTLYLGKYQLVSIIGAGGFGVIYLAHQVFLDRLVAIKMLKSNLASAKARIRFHQEGKASSALHHPAIVAINDFGIDDLDRPYMVMEYVEGVTLSDVIRERITLNVAEAMPIFLELLDGLAAAHSKGIVHRDIKPGNIMLTMGEDGVHVKLLDFGIAKLLDEEDHTVQSLTKTGEALGTPLYMSPEQIQGFKIDYRSDLYSLGCVMFSCLTGAPPFVGEQKFMTMDKHLTEQPLTLKEASLGLDFPPELEAVVAKLLAKLPRDRHQSADEVRAVLIQLSQKLGLLPDGATQAFNATGSGGRALKLPSSVVDIVSGSQGAKAEVDALPSKALTYPPTQQLTREERTRAYTINDAPTSGAQANTEVDQARGGRAKQAAQNQTGTIGASTGYLTGRHADGEDGVADEDQDDDDDDDEIRQMPSWAKPAMVSLAVLVLLAGASAGAFYLLKPKPAKPVLTHAGADPSVGVPSNLPPDMPLNATPPQVRTEPQLPDGSDDETVISSLSRSSGIKEFKSDSNRDLTDKVMPTIGALTALETLSLDNTKITNAGLKYLVKSPVSLLSLKHTKIDATGVKYIIAMPKLVQLFVNHTTIGDESMPLLGTKYLISLGLSKTPVTVSGIKALVRAKNLPVTLRWLDLDGCEVGNEVISVLKSFPQLSKLNLDSTKVDGRGFADLAQLKTVSSLSLADNKQISDYDMPQLAKMQQLVTLDLSNTKVTPAGLRSLKNLKNLKNLWLCGINLDTHAIQAISAFKKELPECHVEAINRPPRFW